MSVQFNFLEHIVKDRFGLDLCHRSIDLLNEVAATFISFPEAIEPPSSAVVALSANVGNDMTSSLSCALNCVTDNHLLLERICNFLESNEIHSPDKLLDGRIIPGMGHPSIKGEDPRVKYLLNEFSDLAQHRVDFYLQAEQALPVHINIGGAMCSLMLDSGLPNKYIAYFPLIGRLFGWCEIYHETKTNFPKVVPSHKIIHENEPTTH